MTPEITDPLAVELIELMLKSWPKEKDDIGELLSERMGRIHVAGHLVMAEILGVSAVDPSFDWPRCCTNRNDFSITQRITDAPAGTPERGLLETDILICLAGIAAESIDAVALIDQRRARLERAAAQEYLRSVEDDEKVRHYWLAYLFELARAELSNGWHEVERAEIRLIPLGRPAAPRKPETRARPILDYAVFQNVREAVAKPPGQEGARPVTPPAETDRGQRNAGYVDDGMLDSRLDVFALPALYVKSLGKAGVMTVRDLISLRRDEMEQVRGIGEKGSRAIEAVLNAEGYRYMPGDYPERWRRCVPGSEEEAARAWKTDPSAPVESVGLERLGRNRRLLIVLPSGSDGRPRFGAGRFSRDRLSHSAAHLQSRSRCPGDLGTTSEATGAGGAPSSRNGPANRRDRALGGLRRPSYVLSRNPPEVRVLTIGRPEGWPQFPLDGRQQDAYPAITKK